jgi:hypothetical protein
MVEIMVNDSTPPKKNINNKKKSKKTIKFDLDNPSPFSDEE